MTLHLRGPASIDVSATHNGEAHSFKQTAAETAEWAPGRYWWSIRAESDDSDVIEIETGELLVAPDMVAAPGFDGRTDAEKALAAIDAVLAKRATIDQERYRINNRELYRTPIADLMKLRAHYAATVRRECRKAAGLGGWGRTIPVRFS
ncbi:MAG: hypothetical protein DI569_12995 [Sphingopyxis macrogoltabida]|uniref:Uncharacterized protein n=1 Tax=Sphingopyxis macrogoltabida TaxID=33050 RepID=A0A2W5KYV3_SPHMC|nr:MAG: hypothetical protein DI569_12995 [Sphingopyxis macrogoltabida]